MAFPTGAIPLTGFVGTTSSGDVFPTHLDTLQLGGARAVDDNTERDAITLERRKFGMLVYSVGANTCYVLANASMGGADNDLSNNSNWIVFLGGGSVTVGINQVAFGDSTTGAIISRAGFTDTGLSGQTEILHDDGAGNTTSYLQDTLGRSTATTDGTNLVSVVEDATSIQ